MNDYDNSRMPNIPMIKRARGWRLYTEHSRLVDLRQAGGLALFGHKPSGLVKTLKNTAERGLLTPLPSHLEARLQKTLGRLFPERIFSFFSTDNIHLLPENLPVYRPFSGRLGEAVLKEPMFLPLLPSPFGPTVLAGSSEKSNFINDRVAISPLALACATQAVWMILNHTERGKLNFKKLETALKNNSVWKQEGIYLFYTGCEDWAQLFSRFLDAGFLIPENSSHPIIIPGELSAGEESKLASILTTA